MTATTRYLGKASGRSRGSCWEVLREPMLALLVGAGLIYLALGDAHEALILIVFAGLSIVITVAQETRTEHALEALRDLTSPRALVIRDGARQRIAGRDVVRGDAQRGRSCARRRVGSPAMMAFSLMSPC